MIPIDMIRDAQRLVSPVNVIAREDPEPRDWYFTFGSGHRAYARLGGPIPLQGEQGQGFRLADRYVIIHGTYTTARQRMYEIFGAVWSSQYGTRESAGVDEYGLTELVITDA